MDFRFKIFDPTIIDCSSCHNTVFPDPESLKILLEIILKICESEVVTRIGEFQFRLNDIELHSPRIIGSMDYDHEVNFSHKSKAEDFTLHMSRADEINKTAGLYVKLKEKAPKKIRESHQKGTDTDFKSREIHYVESGLEGIRKVLIYAKSLLRNQRNDLPSYLKNVELIRFAFSSGVIWQMDADFIIIEDEPFEYVDYERCYLRGNFSSSGCEFSFGNMGGDSIEIYNSPYYLEHLNKITEILENIAPSKYIAGPFDMPKLLEFGVIKKEGRKLTPVEENDELEERFMDYEAFSIVDDLTEDEIIARYEKYSNSNSDDPDRLGCSIHDNPWYYKNVTKMRAALGKKIKEMKKKRDENENELYS